MNNSRYKYVWGYTLLLLCFSLLILSCPDPLTHNPPAQEYGYFSLNANLGRSANTIKPLNIDEDEIDADAMLELEFTGTYTITELLTWGTRGEIITLPVGTYALTVILYEDTAGTTPLLKGTAATSILINAGDTTYPSDLDLLPITNAGTGTFVWDITLPFGLASASMLVVPVTVMIGGINVDFLEYPDWTLASFPSGIYEVTITLKNSEGIEYIRVLSLHIYQNMTSTYTDTFTDSVFYNSPENPFLVYNETELGYVGWGSANSDPDYHNWTNHAYYQLADHIDLSAVSNWDPIPEFYGDFDGGGYTIGGIKINATTNDQGLFAAIGEGGVVKNLGLVDVDINGNQFVGGIAGLNSGGTIENCYVTGEINGNDMAVGGITGSNAGTIKNCYVTANVSSNSQSVGGIAGSNGTSPNPGTIQNCYNTGTVSGTNFVGGIVGNVINGTVQENIVLGLSVTGSGINVGRVAGIVYGSGLLSNWARDDMLYKSSPSDTGSIIFPNHNGTMNGKDGGVITLGAPATTSGSVFLDFDTDYTNTNNPPDSVWVHSQKASDTLFQGDPLPTLRSVPQNPAPTVPSHPSPVTVSKDGGPEQGFINLADAFSSGFSGIGVYTVTLNADQTLSGTSTATFGTAEVNVTINGNGHEITLTSNGSLLRITENQTVTIEDTKLIGQGVSVNNNTALVYVTGSGSKFIMNSGAVSQNTAVTTTSTGGGVYIATGATFTMNDGTVSENRSTSGYGGGGVYVTGSDSKFIMNGGSVSGNTSTGTSGSAGGVYVGGGGNFTMNDGSVSENTNTTGVSAGGVYVGSNNTSKFIMNGGSLSGNIGKQGGGVCVYGGTFNMFDGTISDHLIYNSDGTKSGAGGGVYLRNSGVFTMSGGTISGNTAHSGGGVYLDSISSFTMSGTALISGNTTSPITSGGSGGGTGGGVFSQGSFTMEGGTINGNTANSTVSGGGGVYVISGTFNMNDGTISGNTAATNGGGVNVSGGSFTMSGGTVYGNETAHGSLVNTAVGDGASLYVDGGTAEYAPPYGSGNIIASGNSTDATLPSYSIGGTGPGGGTIFYHNPAGFTVQGYGNPSDPGYFPNYTAYYLEAASAGMSNTPLAWVSGSHAGTDITGTETAIGTGRKNTALILAMDSAAPAAYVCNIYSNNGRTDWFLPSREELLELYTNKNAVGMGSETGNFWSSSQQGVYYSWFVPFNIGVASNGLKSDIYYVHAIRAF